MPESTASDTTSNDPLHLGELTSQTSASSDTGVEEISINTGASASPQPEANTVNATEVTLAQTSAIDMGNATAPTDAALPVNQPSSVDNTQVASDAAAVSKTIFESTTPQEARQQLASVPLPNEQIIEDPGKQKGTLLPLTIVVGVVVILAIAMLAVWYFLI